MKIKKRRVSANFAKNEFKFVGLVLLLYALSVAYLPFALTQYANITVGTHPNLNNILLRIAYLYLIVIFGTFVPFFILMKHSKIKIKDIWAKCSFSSMDILINTIVFTAIGTTLIFMTSIINNYVPFGTGLMIPIGVPSNAEFIKEPLYLFLCIVATPIIEEFAFRGVLLKSLGRFGYYFAMVASSLIFAVFHGSYAQMLPAFALGIFLSQITLRYRSVQPAVIIHILYQAIIYGIELIPEQYYIAASVIIFAIYMLTLILMLTRQFRFPKIHKRHNVEAVSKLFFTRFVIIFVFVMMLIFAFLNTSGLQKLLLPLS